MALLMLVPALVLLIGRSTAEWVLLVALEVCLWAVWWLRQGRYAHPIRELRWEREEWRRGRPRSSQEYVSYEQAWKQAGGDPDASLHPPSTARPSPVGHSS